MNVRFLVAAGFTLITSTFQVEAIESISGSTMVGMFDMSAGVEMNKGNRAMEKKDFTHARQFYDAAIARDPKEWPAYFNRARAFAGERNWKASLDDLNTTLRLKPSFFLAAVVRAMINEHLGNSNAALSEYEHLLSLHPMAYTRALILNDRAWLRATSGDAGVRDGHKAIEDAKASCNLTSWSKPEYVDTLAAAYAEAGDFQSAIQTEERALKNIHDTARQGYEQRLAIFQSHHPFRYASR